MTSKAVAFLLAGLGVTKTHSRPYVSNDNPYSESQFKTMKYRPEFPERFGCYQDAHRFLTEFFPWYNHEHHHSGLGYLTPYEVHYGLAENDGSSGQGCSKKPLRKTLSVLCVACQNQLCYRLRHGSTNRERSLRPQRRGYESIDGRHRTQKRLPICPITNDQPSGKGMTRAENHSGEDVVV